MGLFHGKNVISASSQVSYPKSDAKVKDLFDIIKLSSDNNTDFIDEIVSNIEHGEFTNIDRFYGKGKSNRWSGGVSQVQISKSALTQPIELTTYNKFQSIRSISNIDVADLNNNEFIKILSVSIGYPTATEWITRQGNIQDYTYAAGEIAIAGNTAKAYVYYRDGKLGLGNRVSSDTNHDADDYVYILSEDADNINIGYHPDSGIYAKYLTPMPRATEELYYIFTYELSSNRTRTLILKYDPLNKIFPELDYILSESNYLSLTAFPVVPIFANKEFSSIYVYDKWKSYSGSNRGHTMYPRHMRKDIKLNISASKWQEQQSRHFMIMNAGIDEETLIEGFIESIKYPRPIAKDTAALEALVTSWNQRQEVLDNVFLSMTSDDVLDYIHEAQIARLKILCYEDGDDEVIQARIQDSKYNRYIKFNQDTKKYFKYQAGNNTSYSDKYMYFINQVEDITDYTEIEESMDNTNSIFISFGLNLFDKKQVVNKAINLSFDLIYQNFKDTQNTNNNIDYLEGSFNKRISFKSISKSMITKTLDEILVDKEVTFDPITQEPIITESPSEYSKHNNTKKHKYIFYYHDIKDEIYTSHKIEFNKELNKYEHTYISIEDMEFYSSISEDNLSKVVRVKISDDRANKSISMPLIKEVYNDLSGLDKNLISNYAMSIEIYVSNVTHLQWYQTEEFMSFVKVALIVAEVAYIILTAGAGATNAELVFAAARTYVTNLLLGKGMDILMDNLSPELREAFIILYTAYQIYSMDTKGLSGVTQTAIASTNALNNYNKLQAEEIKDIQEQMKKDSDEYKEAKKELEELKQDLEVQELDGDINPIPESSSDFMGRTQSLPLGLNIDIDSWYRQHLNVDR